MWGGPWVPLYFPRSSPHSCPSPLPVFKPVGLEFCTGTSVPLDGLPRPALSSRHFSSWALCSHCSMRPLGHGGGLSGALSACRAGHKSSDDPRTSGPAGQHSSCSPLAGETWRCVLHCTPEIPSLPETQLPTVTAVLASFPSQRTPLSGIGFRWCRIDYGCEFCVIPPTMRSGIVKD